MAHNLDSVGRLLDARHIDTLQLEFYHNYSDVKVPKSTPFHNDVVGFGWRRGTA